MPNPMVYNGADQLTVWPGQHAYAYTAAGSLSYQEDEWTFTQKMYEYTPANLLASVTHVDVSGVPVSSMTWDADGNRVTFTSSTGGTWSFVYDTTAGIPAVIEETGPVYYIREPNGALVARMAGEDTKYYHFDALGSTRLLTNSPGAVTDTYTYDAWGNLVSHTGSTAQPYQFVGQVGYYTHVQDANLALLQLGVRFYDPSIGRFTQVDPELHMGVSVYAYVGNSPLAQTDPGGRSHKSRCDTLRERIGGKADRTGEHGSGAHVHKKPCKNLLDAIREYVDKGCLNGNDYAGGLGGKRPQFCDGACTFYRVCRPECFEKEGGPIDDSFLREFYDLCGCE